MARTLPRVGGARAFFLSWLTLCQGRLGGSPARAGGGPVAVIRPGGRKSGGRVRLLGRQSTPVGCTSCAEASGPSFLGMSGAWDSPEKTVSTLEKTKVLTVFSKVPIEFSKVLTVFGGFCGVKTGALTACGNDALCGFRGWTGVLSSFGAVSSVLWTRKKASGGEAFGREITAHTAVILLIAPGVVSPCRKWPFRRPFRPAACWLRPSPCPCLWDWRHRFRR